MKTLVVRRFGGPEVLEIVDRPRPSPGRHQVLVRVAASSVNQIDLSTRAGHLTGAGLLAPADEVALGWDVAGTIDAVGPSVDRFRVGDTVIGLRDLMFTVPGAQAEYVVLDDTAIARAPRTASLTAAATLPLNGITAAQALELAELRAGQTLLVTGAAGAVGGYAVELAAQRGIRVVAVAAADDESLVRDFGAADFIARAEPLAAAVRAVIPGGVDAVIDAAVLGIKAHDALRGRGTFVSLVRPFAPPPIRGTRVLVQEAYADGALLGRLAALVDENKLTLRVAETFPISDAARAHARLEARGVRGRLVLVP